MMLMSRWNTYTAIVLVMAMHLSAETYGRPAILNGAGLEQKFGSQVPLDIPLTDEDGRTVSLGQFAGKPIVLALVYYQCPSLCSMILNNLARVAPQVNLRAGVEYQVLAISFDPRETHELAAAKKNAYNLQTGNRTAAWHFLTGTDQATRAVADSVGFHFRFDPMTNQYVHPTVLVLLTPELRVSRYLFGIDYPPRDLRLGLVEASHLAIAKAADQVLLFCFHYDPSQGKYSLLIMNILRGAGLLTLALLGGSVIAMLRRDHKKYAHIRRGSTV